MTKIFILITLFFINFFAHAFECEASKIWNKSSETITTKQILSGTNEKVSTDIDHAYFSFTKERDGVYVGMITLGPDYTVGTLSKGNFQREDLKEGFIDQFKLTFVSPRITYILLCLKNLITDE